MKNSNQSCFKVIIAGSRKFNDYEYLRNKCDKILSSVKDKEIWIISGTARGADQLGERYAQEKGYYLMEVPAEWDNVLHKPSNEIAINPNTGKPYWKLAGHKRNETMAQEADALIAFHLNNSKGTFDMIQRAERHDLKIRILTI